MVDGDRSCTYAELRDRCQRLAGSLAQLADGEPVFVGSANEHAQRYAASAARIDELIDGGEKEVESKQIGERVMAHLRQVDPVAYVRFASVYRQFKDIDELRSEIDKVSRVQP